MFFYAMIMFAVAIFLFVCAVMIFQGRTDLIHARHQRKVKDEAAYGRAFGMAMSVIPIACLASGIIAMMGHSEPMDILSVAVLLGGLVVGVICLVVVQKKYTGRFF